MKNLYSVTDSGNPSFVFQVDTYVSKAESAYQKGKEVTQKGLETLKSDETKEKIDDLKGKIGDMWNKGKEYAEKGLDWTSETYEKARFEKAEQLTRYDFEKNAKYEYAVLLKNLLNGCKDIEKRVDRLQAAADLYDRCCTELFNDLTYVDVEASDEEKAKHKKAYDAAMRRMNQIYDQYKNEIL